MRLVTWNVNGLRAVLKKGFEDIMAALDPDVVCLQETKAQADQIEVDEGLYPWQYVNCARKKGYSGTMILSLTAPENVTEGIGIPEFDGEGRVLTADLGSFYLVDVYVPNSGDGLKRLDFRLAWDKAFSDYLRQLEKTKPVLACGDFNVARTGLDVWDEQAAALNAGFTPQERESFQQHFLQDFRDVFRELHQKDRQYTWWSYYSRGREKNEGERIDYWLASPALMDRIRGIRVLDDIYGSDHCPVEIEIAD